MGAKRGFTLLELSVSAAVLGTLLAIFVPALGGVRDLAKLTSCSSQLHSIGVGISTYAASHRLRLPPFTFCDYQGDLTKSGHWGGPSQPNDPVFFGRPRVENVNLFALVCEEMLCPEHLLCSAAGRDLREGRSSYFTYSLKYSTYCLRFPLSEDIFAGSRELKKLCRKGLLDIYFKAAGGQRVALSARAAPGQGSVHGRVPQIRLDRRYRILEKAACGDGCYDPPGDVLPSDVFWWQGHLAPAPPSKNARSYPVAAAWCHKRTFNALRGNGSVQRAQDEENIIRDSTVRPGESLPDDGLYGATQAEPVWQFLDSTR